jgi:hypothetical protein
MRLLGHFNSAVTPTLAAGSVPLAVLGIYCVVAFPVALRLQEIAIPMALGLRSVWHIGLILRCGAHLAAIGCIIGLAEPGGSPRLPRSFLFQVDPSIHSCSLLREQPLHEWHTRSIRFGEKHQQRKTYRFERNHPGGHQDAARLILAPLGRRFTSTAP